MIDEIISTNFHSGVNRPKYYSYSNTPNFTEYNALKNDITRKQKAVVLASSAIGMAPVLAFWAMKKGFSLNPAKLFKTPVKNWALFKYKPTDKVIKYEEPQIISTAIGSVIGGYVGGSIVDPKNKKAKRREVLNQILGNVITPVLLVGGGARVYSKVANKVEKAMPIIKSEKKIAKIFNTVSRNLPNAVVTLGLLMTGVFLGNRISNLINEKIYKKEVDRDVKFTDFACHVDDICMAVSMTNSESVFGSALGRFIPAALLVPGYETGTAKEDS